MSNIVKTIAVMAALAAGGVLTAGTVTAGDFYPDRFKHTSDVPSVSEGSGIPPQYRLR